MNEATPRVTAEDVRNVLPAIDALLFAASHVPVLKPYALTMRAVTGVGQLFIPNYTEDVLHELKRTYELLLDARESEDEDEVEKLSIRLGVVIELLTKHLTQ